MLIWFCHSCGGIKSGKLDSSNKEFQIDTTKFKFRNLRSFDVSSLNKDKIIDKLVAMDSVEKHILLDNIGFVEECYFYSIQNSKNGYKAFTFIVNYELCCTQIVYNVFKNNKLVYSFVISDSAPTETTSSITKSKFISNDTLQYDNIREEEHDELVENQTAYIVDIDSTAQRFVLTNNYQFKKIYEHETKWQEKRPVNTQLNQ